MFEIICRRCKGLGRIPNFKHVDDGICFTCSGLGIETVNEQIYINTQEIVKVQQNECEAVITDRMKQDQRMNLRVEIKGLKANIEYYNKLIQQENDEFFINGFKKKISEYEQQIKAYEQEIETYKEST